MQSDSRFWIIAIPVFFAFPSLVYLGLVTDFNFNLFHPSWLWQAYNQYALSIMDGRFDVPLEAIGYEGMLYNGKVYMYYGILPAVVRIILSPFFDLETISLSRLLIWLFSIAGVSLTQWVILEHFRKNQGTRLNYFIVAITSMTLWFGSAHFTIVQNGSLYNEPYAFSLFLVSAYLALFARDVIFKKTIVLRLKLFALISGLALFARPNTAVFLYFSTVVLIAISFWTKRNMSKNLWQFTAPLLILFVFGICLLSINYLRFDNPFALSAGTNAASLIETSRERICGYQQSGQFNLLRLIPQFLFYMNGDYSVYRDISDWLGLGFVRTEHPHAILVQMWGLAFISLLVMVYVAANRMTSLTVRRLMIGSFMIIALLSTIIILSYVTVTIRYIADVWMPFGLAVMWGYGYLTINANRVFEYRLYSATLTSLILTVMLVLTYLPIQFAINNYKFMHIQFVRLTGNIEREKHEQYKPNPEVLEMIRNPLKRPYVEPCELQQK